MAPTLIENKDKLLKFDDHVFLLPKNLLLENNYGLIRKDSFRIEEFMIPRDQLDLISLRSYIPTSLIFEVNFKCVTNCVYCYANRSHVSECSIPIDRIKELIQEAKKLRLRSFDLSGGEVFLYENWEILLRELVDNGFMPYISTKIPLDEEMWNSEKALGLYNLSKDMIGKDSICNNCDQFEPCHKHKGVCWKQVIAAYGMDKWDYPDPRCPKAPKPERLIWLE